jgi:PqqD family protein of HPr-rel-A system
VLLDALVAIYDRRSGATHLVAAPVPEILTALERGEASLGQLAARLDADEEQEALVERLDELVATGLVERL